MLAPLSALRHIRFMESFVETHETAFRFTAFASLPALFAALESASPNRGRALPRTHHWFTNMGMVVLSTVMLRTAFPLATVGAALWTNENGIDHLYAVDCPGWLELVVALAVFGFVIWSRHRAFHKFPLLWRMHRTHHNLRLWDRMFGSYRAQPRAGHADVETGLGAWRDKGPARLLWSLLLPFSGLETGQPASGEERS